MQGSMVPFLGAGVSQQASNPKKKSFQPTVKWMEEALAQKLGRRLAQYGCTERSRAVLGMLSVPWQEGKAFPWELFAKACKEQQFGHLAEIASWVMPHTIVCKTIGIQYLAHLEPRPAHRYLVYLAREGLLTEIMTTNYDTCIEAAFKRTFAPEEGSSGELPPGLAVVTSLEEYRQHGGRLLAMGDRYQRPVLKLYKINGCAQRRGEFEHIILTERQLHNFSDERQWSAHLFCDRARSRSLVFSGFGSDEPQIRHTVLTLMEEFSRQPAPDHPDALCSLPNAPWVVAYAATLSYSQLQILHAFRRVHSKHPSLEECAQHTFTGREVQYFEAQNHETTLPADLFWKRVFQSIYLGLLWQYADIGSWFYTWLQTITEQPESIREELFAWLDPEHFGQQLYIAKQHKDAWKQALPAEKPFGEFPWLLEEEEPCSRLRLSHWLFVIHHPLDNSQKPDNYYLPLREDSISILTLLYLFYRLVERQKQDWYTQVSSDGPVGLTITIPVTSAAPSETHTVQVVGHATLPSGPLLLRRTPTGNEDTIELRSLWVIEVPSLLRHISQEPGINAIPNNGNAHTLRVTCKRIPAHEILKKSETIDFPLLSRYFAEQPLGRVTRATLIAL